MKCSLFRRSITKALLFSLAASSLSICCIQSSVLAGDPIPGNGKEDVWMKARTLADIGRLQLDGGKYDDAINSFKSAINLYAADISFYSSLGLALEKTNRLREAERVYKDALQKDPKSAESWYRLAEISTKLHNSSQAESAYTKAYEFAPGDFAICFKQAINLSSRDAAKSASLMKKAASLASTVKEKAEMKQYLSKVAAESAPPPQNAIRLFKITTAASPNAAAKNIATQYIGKDGLFAYSGPAGVPISQRGLKRVLELILVDNSNRRMRLSSQDALRLMSESGIAGLKAKGWAGEVRPVPVTDVAPDTETGTKFVIPTAL